MTDGPRVQPLSDPVARLVTGYLLDRMKEVEGVDEDLLDRAMELYRVIEEEGVASRSSKDLEKLRDNRLIKGFLALLGHRARHVADAGLRIARDNRRLMVALRERLEAAGVDPADPADVPRAELEYERVLAETVPLADSLDNVAAIADAIELANHGLNPEGRIARRVHRQAIDAALPLLVREKELRAHVGELRDELEGSPERLERLAEAVRDEGPRIVRAAYARGGGGRDPAVLRSADGDASHE